MFIIKNKFPVLFLWSILRMKVLGYKILKNLYYYCGTPCAKDSQISSKLFYIRSPCKSLLFTCLMFEYFTILSRYSLQDTFVWIFTCFNLIIWNYDYCIFLFRTSHWLYHHKSSRVLAYDLCVNGDILRMVSVRGNDLVGRLYAGVHSNATKLQAAVWYQYVLSL